MDGYFTGIMDVFYAPLAEAAVDSVTTKPTYSTPKVMGKSIEVTITPTYKEGKLYASNATVRNRKQVDTYAVSFNADKIAPEILQELLGRTIDTNKVQKIKGNDIPATVALGLAYTLDDGEKELWWLYKGSFWEPVKSGKTEGENVEYQTPTIEGVFLRRIFDNEIAAVVETGVTGIGATVESGWFTAVYETPAGE